MNIVILKGRLTRKPEFSGKSDKVAWSTLAVDRDFKDAQGNKVTDFIPVKWIGEKKAQFAVSYLDKGTSLTVAGSIAVDQYTDKDGNKNTSYNVIVNNTEFNERRSANNDGQAQAQSSDGFMDIPAGAMEELPFA